MYHQHIYNLIKNGKDNYLFNLLNNGYISSDIIFAKGRTMLHVSVYYNRKKIVSYLVNFLGMIDNIIDEDGKTALHVASINSNDLDYIRLLLNEDNINEKDYKGFTPVMYSYYRYNYDVTRYLISMGAEYDEIPSLCEKNLLYNKESINIPKHFINEFFEMAIKNKKTCPVCYDIFSENNIILTNCYHTLCLTCFNNEKLINCPMCRKEIKN